MNIDATDKKILAHLAENADASATEIGNAVGLSVPAVNKRIRRLTEEKVIKSFTVLTDGKKLDKPITAFIFLVFRYGDGAAAILDYLDKDPDVLECYAVTGEYDYLIKVCARDVETLEDKLLNLKKQRGVDRSHTMLALMEHKFSPTVLPDDEESGE